MSFPWWWNFDHKKFFVYKFSLSPNTTSPNGNILEWILRRKWDLSTKITLVFHSYYHHLLPPTKRAVKITTSLSLSLLLHYFDLLCKKVNNKHIIQNIIRIEEHRKHLIIIINPWILIIYSLSISHWLIEV